MNWVFYLMKCWLEKALQFIQRFKQFDHIALFKVRLAFYVYRRLGRREQGRNLNSSAMKKGIVIPSNLLAALMLCGLLLHAGKNSTGLTGGTGISQKTGTEYTIVKARDVETMGRFIPSVLLF
jgi:hypothetical protein